MSYDDLQRNLDTYGDGEDGPEVQEHYKALEGLDRLLESLTYIGVSPVDNEEEDLMRVVTYVFEHFDDPRQEAPPHAEMLRLLTVITKNFFDVAEPDQNALASAMSDAEDLVGRLTQS